MNFNYNLLTYIAEFLLASEIWSPLLLGVPEEAKMAGAEVVEVVGLFRRHPTGVPVTVLPPPRPASKATAYCR